jgi:putative glutamine amidotransferase
MMDNKVIKCNNYFYVFVFLVVTLYTFGCERPKEKDDGRVISIGIINPGVGSLRGFADLVENQVLKIDDLQFVAICYEKAERDYSRVKNFIESRNDQLFRFQLIKGELKLEDLFKKNILSSQFREIFNSTDGLFFLGGADFPPFAYNEKTSLLTNVITPYRHYIELSLLFHLLGGQQDSSFVPLLREKENYVIIGFCLGMQSLNVATGGSMYQDIPFELYNKEYIEDVLKMDPDQQHQNYWQNLIPDNQMIWAIFHRIKPVRSHQIFNDQLWENNRTPHVYSSHHQAVKETGLNIKIIATSLDEKVPEIIIHEKYKNVFGVQFHPEVSSLYHENGLKLKHFPADTLPENYYTFLQSKNSLSFHFNLWKKVGNLFVN